MSSQFFATFIEGKQGSVICRLPSGKIAFPSRSFRSQPKPGDRIEVTIESESEKVAWVAPLNPSFLVTLVQVQVNSRTVARFRDEAGNLYVEGFNWDWSHPYPRLGEKWRVSVQTVKNGDVYVLPYGSDDNPMPKKITPSHPRAKQLAGCWKYSVYNRDWIFIQEIQEDENGGSFVVAYEDGRTSTLYALDSEAIFREKFDASSMRYDAVEQRIKEFSIR